MSVLHESDDVFRDIEADLRFVLLVLSGIEGANARLRWVRQNLPRTAQLIGADGDLVPGGMAEAGQTQGA